MTNDDISYIMENLHSKPLNELRSRIGMAPIKTSIDWKEYEKMEQEGYQVNRMPNADWFREKLGVSQGLADRFSRYRGYYLHLYQSR